MGNGAKTVRERFRYTTLAKALHAHLESSGLVLEPEVRFGPYTSTCMTANTTLRMRQTACFGTTGTSWPSARICGSQR